MIATAPRAIVTGASGGLGLEFARLLAADGIDLVLVARSRDALEAEAADLRTRCGVAVETLAEDLATLDSAARVFARVPSCDILINNAGFGSNGAFDTLPLERIREELLLNVVALTELTRRYLPGMRERGSGRIMNVASTAAFLPGPFMAVYYATKAYVLSFSQALAEELRGSGVTVSCLCPGATATGFARRAHVEASGLFRLPVADAPSVARAGYTGMMNGKDLIVPGLFNKLVGLSPKITPRRLLLAISRRLVEPR
ncbi:MAG TPA: SDR family oxidoreductase [Candidatus Baltobacteraceae bacterium]|nr:SDR family oxidoreductase [Candidatus Baltobacteraceae bacterium]